MLHEADVANPVDRTLEYSRPIRSLKLWLAFRTYGADAFRGWIERTLALARALADAVDADPSTRAAATADALDGLLPSSPERRGATWTATTCGSHRRSRQTGAIYLAPATIDDRVYLRACLINFRTTAEDVGRVLNVVRELGRDLAVE